MATQSNTLQLTNNSVNYPENMRRLISAKPGKYPRTTTFGEFPSDGKNRVFYCDWHLYDEPSEASALGMRDRDMGQSSTNVAESPLNHFVKIVKRSEVDIDARADGRSGTGATATLGLGAREQQIQINMENIMIDIETMYGSNIPSQVGVAGANGRNSRAGTPVTFFSETYHIGTATAPTNTFGYNDATQLSREVVDATGGAAGSGLPTLQQIVRATTQLQAAEVARYPERDAPFYCVLPQYINDNLWDSPTTGLLTLQEYMIDKSYIGLQDGSEGGLAVELGLNCINSTAGKVVLLPTLDNHEMAIPAAGTGDDADITSANRVRGYRNIMYVCRPEFMGVAYAVEWWDKELFLTPNIQEIAVGTMMTFVAPPKKGGVVFTGLSNRP